MATSGGCNCTGGCPDRRARQPSSASSTTTLAAGSPPASTVGRRRSARDSSPCRTNGTLPPDVDVETLATAMLAALQGGLLLCQMHRSTEPLEAALDTLIAHVESLGAGSSRRR